MEGDRRRRFAPALATVALSVAAGLPPIVAVAAPAPAPACRDRPFGLWSTGEVLAQGRRSATATRLTGDLVAVVGGSGDDSAVGRAVGPLDSAELWDASTGAVRALPPLGAPRVGHTATLLG